MKTIIKQAEYQCKYCKNIYKDKTEAIRCEQACFFKHDPKAIKRQARLDTISVLFTTISSIEFLESLEKLEIKNIPNSLHRLDDLKTINPREVKNTLEVFLNNSRIRLELECMFKKEFNSTFSCTNFFKFLVSLYDCIDKHIIEKEVLITLVHKIADENLELKNLTKKIRTNIAKIKKIEHSNTEFSKKIEEIYQGIKLTILSNSPETEYQKLIKLMS